MYIVKDLPPQIESSRLDLLAKAEPATVTASSEPAPAQVSAVAGSKRKKL